jgi:hypothetical protein
MRKPLALLLCLALPAALAWALPRGALPRVDGQVTQGEYGHSASVLYGSATLYWQGDGSGGLYLAVSAQTSGWVGLGLGRGVMDGSRIFMGYVKEGRPFFSEQVGAGHSHVESPATSYDSFAVAQQGGTTTIEFHLPAASLPTGAKSLGYIVAFAGSADLSTYHEDNREGGSLELPAD